VELRPLTLTRVWKRTKRIMLVLVLVAISIGQLFPLFWLFIYSLQTSGDLFGRELIKIPTEPQWGNYVRAWRDGRIPEYATNSAIIVLVSVLLTVLFAFFLAYAVTRMKWKYRSLVRNFTMLGMVVPIHTTLLPNFLWFNWWGLLDTYVGVIVPYVAFGLSIGVVVFSGLLAGIPYSMEESAYLDGAGITRILWYIIGPMTKSGFVTVGIMSFLSCWNEFIMANTYLTSEAMRTLPFSVIRFEGVYSSQYSIQFAVMFMTAIIPIMLYFVLSRWVVAGVTAGAIKE
jgi:raffinose/stachyose/melibiose transport system permease protein